MKRSWLSWLAILAMTMMLFAVTGCSDDDDDAAVDPYNVTGAVAAAGDEYFDNYNFVFNGTTMGVNVPAATAFANIAGDPDYYYVVDMRGGDDYDHMHIEGAVNVSMGGLVDAIELMPTDRVILVMCYSGQTASYATSIINLIGTQTNHRAQNLKFGASGILELEDVKADGTYVYPMLNEQLAEMVDTASSAKHAAGDYPSINTAGVGSDLEALKARARIAAAAWSDDSCKASNTDAAAATPAEMYLINYFSVADYLDGHLPNAIQYTPSSTSTVGDFTTGTALNTLPTDMPIGIYCYTGQTSAQVAAYLQMMGYDAMTVIYGVQKMAYESQGTDGDREGINDVPWHGPSDDYSSIFTSTTN